MRGATRFYWWLAAIAAAGLAAGCAPHEKLLAPFGLPPEVPTDGVARAAFLANVNVDRGLVTITAPRRGMATPAGGTTGGRANSLVGGDAVLLTTSNFHASAVGAFQPGKIRISFDVAVTNRLANVTIVGPTAFPTPPPGTTGPLLLPYDVAIATTSSGATGGGDVIVVLPSGGLVSPSSDWDGAPWNFFNDSSCVTGNDCFRWEEFADIAAGGTTAARTVGFDIDPTVGQFTARLLVGSDLLDPNAPPPGAVRGFVHSSLLGPLANVTVTASPGGATAHTDSTGGFTLTGLSPGLASLSVSGLPAPCSEPAPAQVTVNSGTVITVSLDVQCLAPPIVGSLTGTIQSSTGVALGGLSVTVQPTGLAPEPPVTTDPLGTYLANDVEVGDGTGSFTVGNLPSGCADPGPIPYSGLSGGATLIINVTLACQ
jgi:hypothetical protein